MPMKKSMKLRILFGLIMIAAIVGVLYLDWAAAQDGPLDDKPGVPLAAMWVVVGAVAFIEFARLCKSIGVKVLWVSGLLGSVAVATLPVWWRFFDVTAREGLPGDLALVLIALVLAAIFLEQMIVHRLGDALRQVACTAMAVLYLGVGGAVILGLRVDPNYRLPMLVVFLAAVKFTDIGAYFTGSLIGRHKLIPWLSPGKTWEGLAGGLAIAAGISVLLVWLSGRIDPQGSRHMLVTAMSLPQAAVFGVVVGAVGQFADLCESLLKRAANVKDSGALVPEFGGVLDIIDSPLLAAPAAVVFLFLLEMV